MRVFLQAASEGRFLLGLNGGVLSGVMPDSDERGDFLGGRPYKR